MIFKWIEDCKNNIAKLKEQLQQAKTEEERETIADKIADEQQALECYKGTAAENPPFFFFPCNYS